ncbi:MAG: 2-oxo acid dehydrogenase subunit E2 [Anaerolineae bacterium]|nr:2-oxo acid dehydrogenase subunit E2 [Anaerolineae bacterium]
MAETVTMPKLGFDMAEGTLVRWVKSVGESVQKGDVLAEIETDKATVEVESSFGGVMAQHLVEEGAIVPVGAAIAVITAEGEAYTPVAPTPSESAPPATPDEAAIPSQTTLPSPEPAATVPASPLAKRMARENQLDIRTIKGSGPGGRVVRRDIEQYLVARSTAPATVRKELAGISAPPPPMATSISQPPADQIITPDKLRRAISRRMQQAKQQIPHFYITHEYDVEALMNLRKEINRTLPDEQKVSVNDFIVKATALSLRQFPALNASLSNDQIIRHGHIHIGIAVSLENGLITVVCRDADQKPLRLISQEVKEMAARAREGKVRPEEIEGSTFSISNLGMYDVEHFIAIVNPPEAAILAVGSARQQPVVVNGELKVGTRLKATLSADHRLTDGAEAAKFLQTLAYYIENPLQILI